MTPTFSQRRILRELRERPLTRKDLASRLGSEAFGLRDQLDELISLGAVKRRRRRDVAICARVRRVYYFDLTDAGLIWSCATLPNCEDVVVSRSALA